ncbi:MAG: AAA family ATPase [Alphaproteobacteria bacterium]
MTGWMLSEKLPNEDERKDRWQTLPSHVDEAWSHPSQYVPDEETLQAVNVAIAVGQPLLLTGEPGCGKTALADHVAWQLGLEKALRYQMKSTSEARDLFYRFDQVARFHDAHDTKKSVDPRRFITFQAMGLAILYAMDRKERDGLLGHDADGKALAKRIGAPQEARRSVVLIDEIDKAPRDVPNDLLDEIENMRFRIPELGGVPGIADRAIALGNKGMRPIVILTSNSEKALPDAFLRRCAYHHMALPRERDVLSTQMAKIVANRLAAIPVPGDGRASDLFDDAMVVFHSLRKADAHLQKPPGTAELLNFLRALSQLGLPVDTPLRDQTGWQSVALSSLVKIREDQDAVRTLLERMDWPTRRPRPLAAAASRAGA